MPESLKFAAHALAIDENRRPFKSVVFPSAPAAGKLEERWFTGAHANVGGGYPFDPLANVPLFWMLDQARKKANVGFLPVRDFDVKEALAVRQRDSFREFAHGIPSLIPIPGLFYRRRVIGRQVQGHVEESIDASVIKRYSTYGSYKTASVALRKYFTKFPMTADSAGDIYVKR